jgi:hypothetical protein
MIEVGRIVQLRGPTPPYPHTKNMTTPLSCPAHKRKAKKRERTRTVVPPPIHLQKSTCTLHPPSYHPPPSTHAHNATQTHPSTSHPQLILVLHPPTPGRPPPNSRTHQRTHPSQSSPPRKVPPPHPRSRHPLLLRIAPSLRPRPTLPSILPHFTPLAPHTRLRAAKSENPSPSPPS